MQDETTPPVPLKDVPIQTTQAPMASEQPVTAPVAAPEPLKEPPALKEEQIPVKEEKPAAPKRSSASPVMPVVFSIIVFVALAVCAYFVFKGM